ncbi:hypothetical protein D3C76_999250 [compost metagenome]
MLVTLAGVSSGVRPSREPLVPGVCRSGCGLRSAVPVMSVAGSARALSASAAWAATLIKTQGSRLACSSEPGRELNSE